MDSKQIELDLCERRVLIGLFGSDYENAIGFKLITKKIQNYINKFEAIAKPLMNNDGTINAGRARELAEVSYPTLIPYLPNKDFRLSDILNAITGENK